MGELIISGGASGDEEFFFEDEATMMEEMSGGDMTTIPELIKSFRTAQKNDELRSSTHFRGTKATTTTLDTNRVVSGFAFLPVIAR